MEEFQIEYNIKIREFNDNNTKYHIYLKDIKELKNNIKLLLKNQNDVEEYKYMNGLLDDICIFILDNDIFYDIDLNTTTSLTNISNSSFNKTSLSTLSKKNITNSIKNLQKT